MKTGFSMICETCKKQTYVPIWKFKITKNKRIFCSKKCWLNRISTKHICKTCGKSFRRTESNLKRNKSNLFYCSRDCRYKDSDSYFRSGKLVSCVTCKKLFYKTESMKNQRYCSIKCRSSDKKYRQSISNAKKERWLCKCKSCGKYMYRKKSHLKRNKNHFCSIICRAKSDKGKISHKRNGKTVCCEYCGKKIYRARYRLEKYKRQYCSRLCMNKHLIYLYIRPTNPEKKFMELIDKYNLPYTYVGDGTFWIDNKNPDFIHITKKEVIEVFGDYWHNPALNKHCKYEHTEEGRQKVFKSKGYNCIVIWEKELNKPNWEKNVLKKIGENYANICSSIS